MNTDVVKMVTLKEMMMMDPTVDATILNTDVVLMDKLPNNLLMMIVLMVVKLLNMDAVQMEKVPENPPLMNVILIVNSKN